MANILFFAASVLLLLLVPMPYAVAAESEYDASATTQVLRRLKGYYTPPKSDGKESAALVKSMVGSMSSAAIGDIVKKGKISANSNSVLNRGIFKTSGSSSASVTSNVQAVKFGQNGVDDGVGKMGMKSYYTKPPTAASVMGMTKARGGMRSDDMGDDDKGKMMGATNKKGATPTAPRPPRPPSTPTAPIAPSRPSSPSRPSGPTRPTPSLPTRPAPSPPTRPAPSIPTIPAPPVPLPTNLPIRRSCQPTVGACVSSATALQTAIDSGGANAIVAVCGTGTPIATTTALTINQSDVTLCCAGPGACILASSGADANLAATAQSVTLQDIVFTDGRAKTYFGGNVAIDGDGAHMVAGCEFRSGAVSRVGGNLFVQTRGSITIEDSSFFDGSAGESGGGLYVLNAATVKISGSLFSGNTATNGTGGGYFSVLQNSTLPGQNIVLQDTKFEKNAASIGGGFFVTQLGVLPSLAILNCDFSENQAVTAAGAGAIADSLDNVSLTISSSTAIANVAPVCREILAFYDSSIAPLCLMATKDFP